MQQSGLDSEKTRGACEHTHVYDVNARKIR